MNWSSSVPLIVTAAVAIFGWFAVHQLTTSRDRRNKRREMRLSMMLDAYRVLAGSAHRPFIGQAALDVERALESIQLLGTSRQIELAQRLIKEFADHQGVAWHPLLVDLRDSLRAELELEPVAKRLLHLRAADPPDPNAAALLTEQRSPRLDGC